MVKTQGETTDKSWIEKTFASATYTKPMKTGDPTAMLLGKKDSADWNYMTPKDKTATGASIPTKNQNQKVQAKTWSARDAKQAPRH
eukprot:snap_masked-scaffold_5-processed-gene-3.2-mRNA-1 protein AED:1.00 eAED:1.00 QI:0/-1/0/0/-1/1/1/0/85